MATNQALSRIFVRGIFSDREFYNNLYKIALPIALQNLIASAINMLDTLMIGRVGENEIAAVGIANQIFVVFQLVAVGIYAGGGVFISQFWGKRDTGSIRIVLGIGLIGGCIFASALTIVAQTYPSAVIALFNKDARVISLGVDYLKIVSISYLFSAITFGYAISSRCVQNAALPMVVSIAALFTNGVLNYILIFGHMGFPAMGVAGAAWATVAARVVEMSILVGYIYSRDDVLATRFGDMATLTRDFVLKVCKTAIPVMLNDLCWVLGFVSYTAAYGRINTQAVASVQISGNIQSLFMVLTFGVANASAVMIGNKIGEGEMEAGKVYAKRFVILGGILGVVLGGALALCSQGIVSLFKVSPTVLRDSVILMYITSAVMVIRVLGIIFIVGILRGGGDAKYAFTLEAFTMWLIGVPLTFLGALYFKWPVYYVVALSTAEEIMKFILGLARIRSGKWINNLVRDM